MRARPLGWAAALLLPLLPRPCLAAEGAGVWHRYEYEYNFFEDLLIIVFLFVALSFEIVWHGIGNSADSSYRYGKYHEEAGNAPYPSKKDHHGGMRHPQLYKELYNRMGGEFMTLGLLAFLIFTCNQAGGFTGLAVVFRACDEGCFHHPATSDDWLHLAEIVHVKLFVGMLLYYGMIFCLVRGSVHQIQKWEKLRMRLVHERSLGDAAVHLRSIDRDLEKHILWRDYFIEHMLRLQHSRPEMFRAIMEKCSLDPDAPDADAKLRHSFDERFSLSAYLTLNLEKGVMDSIQVHKPTWGVLLCFFGLFALLHREAHLSLKTLVPAFIGFAFAIFIIMWWFTKESQSKIKRYIRRCRSANERDRRLAAEASASGLPLGQPQEAKANIHERWNTEMLMLRSLQVFLFLIAYVFSQTLLDIHDWKSNTEVTLLNSLLFLVLTLALARSLPLMVPVFVAVMAFPPYVDEANLAACFAALLDEHESAQPSRAGSRGQIRPPFRHVGSVCSGGSQDNSESTAVSGGPSLAAVRELADLLGVSEQLERRLRGPDKGLAAANDAAFPL